MDKFLKSLIKYILKPTLPTDFFYRSETIFLESGLERFDLYKKN